MDNATTPIEQPAPGDDRGSVEAIDDTAAEQDLAVNGGLATASRRNLADDVAGERDPAAAAGYGDSPGMPGGTLGTGGASEQDA